MSEELIENSTRIGISKAADSLLRFYAAVKRIMALARSLDGVISGEHGIGHSG